MTNFDALQLSRRVTQFYVDYVWIIGDVCPFCGSAFCGSAFCELWEYTLVTLATRPDHIIRGLIRSIERMCFTSGSADAADLVERVADYAGFTREDLDEIEATA